MAGIQNFNHIVAAPLQKGNYEDWFEWVKSYLISQDLWEVTSSSATPDRNSGEDFARWERKNAAALHVIRISCGLYNLSFIKGVTMAIVAWDNLYRIYNAPPDPPPRGMTELVDFDVGLLYKAIADNKRQKAKEFIDQHPTALSKELAASTGQTALHVAVKFGHVSIVEELVTLVPPQYLEISDAQGYTPLAIAASYSGVIRIAECLVDKNSNILAIPHVTLKGALPVALAFWAGHPEMGRYLYSKTPLEVLRSENGHFGTLLIRSCFLTTGNLDVALDLLQRCKELLFATDSFGISTIELIAFSLSDYLNKVQLVFWKRWVYNYIRIPSTTTPEHLRVDVQQEGESGNTQGVSSISTALDILYCLISHTPNLLGMKEIRRMKLQQARAAEILNLACRNLIFLNEAKKKMISRALSSAAGNGNLEFLLQMSKANPEIITLLTSFKPGRQPFFKAVENRQAEIFNFLCGFRFKNAVIIWRLDNGNNLLHTAGLLAPSSQLNSISGAALQMQRELQWFKVVENLIEPGIRFDLNNEGLSPLDLFKKSHKELRNEGEKWMKDTASSCSVVGALIVTIMFAAAFTVPGGNDQTSGYPIFLKEKLFIFFIISDALSLFSSTTSVLTFLGILTSRYAEEDFLYSLPKKLIIGLSALFLSIATMMMAFSATIIIMLQHRSAHLWAFLPVIMLASVPVALFVLLQFPLLVQMISSTYGPGIFKKVEMWP